jgi:hypothetical protein
MKSAARVEADTVTRTDSLPDLSTVSSDRGLVPAAAVGKFSGWNSTGSVSPLKRESEGNCS